MVTDEVIAFIRCCLKDDELYGTKKQCHTEILEWLSTQELSPKQITELLHHCQLEGCEAVMKHAVLVSIPAPASDIVEVQAVDLSVYDRLCTGKVGVG